MVSAIAVRSPGVSAAGARRWAAAHPSTPTAASEARQVNTAGRMQEFSIASPLDTAFIHRLLVASRSMRGGRNRADADQRRSK
jgi:hypothetical protein